MEKDGLKKHVYIKEIETGEVMRVIEEKQDGLLQFHAGIPGQIPEIIKTVASCKAREATVIL